MSVQPVFFSIIIPTYNRPEQLANCLTALVDQCYSPRCFEVIIVNDGGSSLDDAIAPFKAQLDLVLIDQPNTGPGQARNRGATAAKGEFLAFTDDDCCPAADWLQQLAEHCAKMPNVLVGGQTLNSLSANRCSIASQLVVELAYQYFNPQPEQAQFFAANNMVFPRQPFLSIGGFHPSFLTSEDREICDRWLRTGRTMHYVSAVKIYHAHRLTLSGFWKQHLNYGQGAFCYHTIRAQRGAPPFRPDFSFFKQLLTYPYSQLPPHRAVQVAGLMMLSQVASLVGYFQKKQTFVRRSETLCKTPLPLTSIERSPSAG